MKAAELLQSELDRRCQSAISSAIGMVFKSLAAVMIFLSGFFFLTGNCLVYAESDDALFIDQQGNVGIGRQAPQAKLDVNGAAHTSGKQRSTWDMAADAMQTPAMFNGAEESIRIPQAAMHTISQPLPQVGARLMKTDRYFLPWHLSCGFQQPTVNERHRKGVLNE